MKRLILALRTRLPTVQAFALSNMPDLLMLSGATSLAYGAWLIYPPAGFLVAGVLLLVAGVLASHSST